MKVRIVRIGSSQGIRIPKPLLRQTGLTGDVEISVEEGRLVIGPARKARTGWVEAFRAAQLRDDEPLEGWNDLSNEWDEEGWEWQ